ncbi:hypothetical protein TSYNTROOL_19780 [Tepidanaerobacter syntrophicus]|uniref:hypothetical protein n=1 Tax=Tepidanaerobacter syntrophicus TaxID=224999 RepID=UPI0022EEBB03|nr:hypothetical protein [Tepidanaerobacter syntrophicus]GLI51892.1 hypothetical protein TSYNTROOL_19780 [Tepidanaerobacter syntrophicus]
MNIKRVEQRISKEDWNNKISKFKNKTIYHTYEWLEFIEESQGLEKILYEITINEKVEGYLPGFIIKKGPIKIFGSPFPGWTTPYMGPLINENISQELLFSEIKKLMNKEDYHYAEFCNRSLDIGEAKKQKFIIEKGTTYISEVKSTPEEILFRS